MSVTTRRAVTATAAWTLLGLAFTPVVLATSDAGTAGHYLSVFVLEKTLSLDNVAMFAAVLAAARLPAKGERTALAGGLAGALVLRIGFIAAGLAVVDAVHAVLLGFAVVLVASGVQMARPAADTDADPAPRRWVPTALRTKPLAVALVTIVVVDVSFAADSILAAFAITTNAYPVIAANVFAVLGLRSLYVVLSGAMERFAYLKAGIGMLLVAIGVELAVEHWVDVPSWVSLAAVGGCLLGSVGGSLLAEKGVTMRSALRRTAVTIVGFALLLVGVALLVLPGPGLLVIVAGLAVLATEYAWAKRPLAAMRTRLDRLRRRSAAG
jgi:tellurite resistance protein TerC